MDQQLFIILLEQQLRIHGLMLEPIQHHPQQLLDAWLNTEHQHLQAFRAREINQGLLARQSEMAVMVRRAITPLAVAAQVVLVFGQIGQVAEVGEGANDLHRLVARWRRRASRAEARPGLSTRVLSLLASSQRTAVARLALRRMNRKPHR